MLLSSLFLAHLALTPQAKPLSSVKNQAHAAIQARDDPPAELPNDLSTLPVCPVSNAITNPDTCNPGDDVLEAQKPLVINKQPDQDVSQFVGLAAYLNKRSAAANTNNMPDCKENDVIQNVDNCREVLPADKWEYALAADRDSELTNVLELNVAQSCPAARLTDYQWVDGRISNATLIEIFDDAGSSDFDKLTLHYEAQILEMLKTLADSFKSTFGWDIYDYVDIKGTSLDPFPPKKRRRASGPAQTSNVAKAIHKKGDFRFYSFVTVVVGAGVAAFNKGTLPLATGQPSTWPVVSQIGGNTVFILILVGLMVNLREQWRTRTTIIPRVRWIAFLSSLTFLDLFKALTHHPQKQFKRFCMGVVLKLVSWFVRATKLGNERYARWQATHDAARPAEMPSLEDRVAYLEDAIKKMSTGTLPDGRVTLPPLQHGVPMTLQQLNEVNQAMNVYQNTYQHNCQLAANALLSSQGNPTTVVNIPDTISGDQTGGG